MEQEIFLINEIEMCREEMSRAARKNSLTSKEVLQMSIRLDKLMNEYENLKQKEQQPA